MDQAKLIKRYNEVALKCAANATAINVNETQDKIIISGLGEKQDQEKEFTTIQDMELFMEGFELGIAHAKIGAKEPIS